MIKKKNIDDHIDIVLQNLSIPAKELLYKLILIGNRFSKDCVNRIDVDTNSDRLLELIRFGLVSDSGIINNVQTFEMHNMIKSTLLNNLKQTNIVSSIINIITLIHNSLPERSLSRYKLFLADNALFNAIEELEQNAILYKVDFLNTIVLTRHRLIFYLFSRNNMTLDLIQEWFQSNNDKIDINKVHNIIHKISYSECVFVLGLNDFIFKQNIEKGYEQIKFAQNIIEYIPGYQHLKSSIYGQLAQYYVDIGDLDNANASLQKMFFLKTEYPEIELSSRLDYLMKSKIFLNTGQYEYALKEIENYLKEEKSKVILNDAFLNNTYLLKARILNRMRHYQQSKEISLRIYKQPNFKNLDKDVVRQVY